MNLWDFGRLAVDIIQWNENSELLIVMASSSVYLTVKLCFHDSTNFMAWLSVFVELLKGFI